MEAVSKIKLYYCSTKSTRLQCWLHIDRVDLDKPRTLVFGATVISYHSGSKGRSLTMHLFFLLACFKMLWTPVLCHTTGSCSPKRLFRAGGFCPMAPWSLWVPKALWAGEFCPMAPWSLWVPKALWAGGFSFVISFIISLTSVRCSRGIMSHKHGTSWNEPYAQEETVSDEHSLEYKAPKQSN